MLGWLAASRVFDTNIECGESKVYATHRSDQLRPERHVASGEVYMVSHVRILAAEERRLLGPGRSRRYSPTTPRGRCSRVVDRTPSSAVNRFPAPACPSPPHRPLLLRFSRGSLLIFIETRHVFSKIEAPAIKRCAPNSCKTKPREGRPKDEEAAAAEKRSNSAAGRAQRARSRQEPRGGARGVSFKIDGGISGIFCSSHSEHGGACAGVRADQCVSSLASGSFDVWRWHRDTACCYSSGCSWPPACSKARLR